MWNQLLSLVAKVLAPREAALNPAGVCSEIGLATTTTSDRIEIESWMRGCYCEATALTSNCFIQFGDSAVDVVAAKANTLSTETVTFADDVGRCIPAGATKSFIIPLDATHMAWEADAAGTLHLGISSQKVLRR